MIRAQCEAECSQQPCEHDHHTGAIYFRRRAPLREALGYGFGYSMLNGVTADEIPGPQRLRLQKRASTITSQAVSRT